MTNELRDIGLERALPNSAEAERAILGAVILDNQVFGQVVEWLTADDFYIPSHRRIFVAMEELFKRGKPIEPIGIGEELKKESALESVGGISFISNLTFGLPHSSNIEYYAKIVRDKSLLRRALKVCNSITQEILDEEDDAEVILSHAETKIFEVGQVRIRSRLEAAQPIAEKILDKIQEQEGAHALLLGLSTGFTDLDKMTSGLKPSDLVLVAARPGMGKTSYALMLNLNALRFQPEAVSAFFSLEMSKEALVMRMLCGLANIDFHRFRNGFLSKLEWAQIAKALGVLTDLKIFFDDTPGLTVLEMRAKCQRLAAQQKRLDLIIVDYLQLMSGSGKRVESRQQEVSQISRELKGLAKEMNVPLVALSQLSRAPESRSNHRPQLSDLRESGALEQDADEIDFIFREEEYLTRDQRESLSEDRKNVAELIIAKQRNGPTGTVELRWTPSSMRFDNLFRDETPVLRPQMNYDGM